MRITAREFLESKSKLVDSFDAQILLAHVLDISRTQLIVNLDTPLDITQLDYAEELFAELEAGQPLPYILGHWEFFGLSFGLNKNVLIPRPETELLVEKAIAFLKNNTAKRNIADIGTGSGIIAISIAKHTPDAKIMGTDISKKALYVAAMNALEHGVNEQIRFVICDLLPVDDEQKTTDHKSSSFDLVCANLPYIPTKTLHSLEIYGKEPTLALDGGSDGLDLYRKLFSNIPQWLAPDGVLLLEIEATQGKSAVNLAQNHFPNATINLHQDLTGKDRLVEIIL